MRLSTRALQLRDPERGKLPPPDDAFDFQWTTTSIFFKDNPANLHINNNHNNSHDGTPPHHLAQLAN